MMRETDMRHGLRHRALLVLALLGASVSGAGAATDLAPTTARLIRLGAISALTYYTVETDGFRVVTTIQSDDAAATETPMPPVRFIVTLAPSAEARISVPQEVGPAIELRIARIGNVIEVGQLDDRGATADAEAASER